MITAERRAQMREYIEKDIQYKWPDCQGSVYARELLDEIERLERQVNWLAMQCQNVRRFPIVGKPEDDWTAYKWREAARRNA